MPQSIFHGLAAALESPPFTGTPTAPTAPPGTDTDQIATTAFVTAAVAKAIADLPGGGKPEGPPGKPPVVTPAAPVAPHAAPPIAHAAPKPKPPAAKPKPPAAKATHRPKHHGGT
jgi:hypothetical protein